MQLSRLGKILYFSGFIAAGAAAGWYGYGEILQRSIPKVEIRELTPTHAAGDSTLPFFELMSPLPVAGHQVLPKLEYKKGPPARYLERISVLFHDNPNGAKERVIYYGRHTRHDLLGLGAFADEPAREAHYVEAAIRLSQGESSLSPLQAFFLRPLLLREAARWLEGAESVAIMDQAGTPAFLFRAAPGAEGRAKATALFLRHNSFYRVDYLADRGFSVLDPEALFRKSFLVEKRADALAYVAQNLADTHVNEGNVANLKSTPWPVLLLAANLSIDPASIDSYFHFAGLNAYLYRALAGETNDLEVSDALRNNVLAADHYAQDVAPDAPKTAEIARWARLLVKSFDQ